jgi:hypothetical protein
LTERLKAVVVDSEAARELVVILTRMMFDPDEFITPRDVGDVIVFANEIIATYITDPPYLEELLEDQIVRLGVSFEDLMEQVGALLDNATKHIYYDITEVKHTFIADDIGTVLLMI